MGTKNHIMHNPEKFGLYIIRVGLYIIQVGLCIIRARLCEIVGRTQKRGAKNDYVYSRWKQNRIMYNPKQWLRLCIIQAGLYIIKVGLYIIQAGLCKMGTKTGFRIIHNQI